MTLNDGTTLNDQALGGIAIPPPPPPAPGQGVVPQGNSPQQNAQVPFQTPAVVNTQAPSGTKSMFQDQLRAEIAQIQATLERIENMLDGS